MVIGEVIPYMVGGGDGGGTIPYMVGDGGGGIPYVVEGVYGSGTGYSGVGYMVWYGGMGYMVWYGGTEYGYVGT